MRTRSDWTRPASSVAVRESRRDPARAQCMYVCMYVITLPYPWSGHCSDNAATMQRLIHLFSPQLLEYRVCCQPPVSCRSRVRCGRTASHEPRANHNSTDLASGCPQTPTPHVYVYDRTSHSAQHAASDPRKAMAEFERHRRRPRHHTQSARPALAIRGFPGNPPL